MTNNIPVTFLDRKWMRSAHAFRCFVEIPSDGDLPAILTAFIDRKVIVKLKHTDMEIILDPAYIVDVPSTKKGFQLVFETCQEDQNSLGPKLTTLTRQPAILTILPYEEKNTTPPKKLEGRIDERTIKGLHIAFFKNPRFHNYLAEKTGSAVAEPNCKEVFKHYLDVQSCKDISKDVFDAMLHDFNAWIKG
jgi:hypothetical protein